MLHEAHNNTDALSDYEDLTNLDPARRDEEYDDEQLEVEEYILNFEGENTKTYKDEDGFVYQYLDNEEIGEILGQLKNGIFIAS